MDNQEEKSKPVPAQVSYIVYGPDQPAWDSKSDTTAIIIYGGGGHGKMVIDLLRSIATYRISGIIDDGLPINSSVMEQAVLGGEEVLPKLYKEGIRLSANAVAGIGNIRSRITIYQKLGEAGFYSPSLVHARAFLEPGAILSPAVQVFANAYIVSEAKVGFGSIINTGVIISHDCIIGKYATLSPGAILAGAVQVGDGALIGMGVTVNITVKIGSGARVGNGATVKADVPDNGVVRAGTIWPG